MDNLLTLAFEAHHSERNHHRRYEIRIGRDLLDDRTVTIRDGRVGQGGQERHATARRSRTLRAILRESPAPQAFGTQAHRLRLPVEDSWRALGLRCCLLAAQGRPGSLPLGAMIDLSDTQDRILYHFGKCAKVGKRMNESSIENDLIPAVEYYKYVFLAFEELVHRRRDGINLSDDCFRHDGTHQLEGHDQTASHS
jgi:hypothetical protein